MVSIWVVLSAVLKNQKIRRSDHHDLQSYVEFMVQIETSSQQQLVEADNLDKDSRSFHLPKKEMEKEHLCDGGFKPPARLQSCAMLR
jgi:hypothetical protein